MKIRPGLGCVACLGLLALSAAACSSSSSSRSSSSSANPASTPTTAAAATPTGPPIKVGTTAEPENLAQVDAGDEVAIKAINAAGGIHGRPIELVSCNTQSDPNQTAACAAQLAADPSIVATVGVGTEFGTNSNPVFQKAGLAGIGTVPLGSGDFNSPVVFPTNIGSLLIVGGGAMAYKSLGARKIGLVYVQTPTAAALGGLMNSLVLGPLGSKVYATAGIPTTAADVAPQAAALAGSDAQVVALREADAIRYVQTARQQGYSGDMIVSTTQVTANDIAKSLSGFSKSLYAVGWYDYTSPGYKAMLAEQQKYDPSATTGDLFANSWLAMHMFATVAAGLPDITRSTVLTAMGALSGYSTDGMTPPISFTTPGTAMGGHATRLVPAVTNVYAYQYSNGAYIPSGSGPITVFGS
jgi:branched-chain amino acid transport system substrate-binding protein